MLNVTMLPEIAAKFKELLEEEDNDEAVIRIRETKVGGGWKSRLVLRVSIDEREDPDEEEEIAFDGIPIVASNEVIEGYGGDFEFYIDEHDMPSVRPKSWENRNCHMNIELTSDRIARQVCKVLLQGTFIL